jgi:hypothetical protein
MTTVVQAPVQMLEMVASFRFPPNLDRHLQSLMDRNNDGTLTPLERDELTDLVELSESMALVRSQALHLLGRSPG